MPCTPGQTIYHALPTRPNHIPCHCPPDHTIIHAITRQAIAYTIFASQTIPYTMQCPPGHTIYPPGHNIYHAMPARPYHISHHVYLGNTIYHDMPSQAIPNTMPCPQSHSRKQCYTCQAIPYTITCLPGHTIYPAMPSRPYHIPCHAR